MSQKTVVNYQGGVFLQPGTCGSAIQWTVGITSSVREYEPKKGQIHYSISGQMRLTDCNRSIEWDVSGDDEIEKLTLAVKELTAARRALKLSLAQYYRLQPVEDDT